MAPADRICQGTAVQHGGQLEGSDLGPMQFAGPLRFIDKAESRVRGEGKSSLELCGSRTRPANAIREPGG